MLFRADLCMVFYSQQFYSCIWITPTVKNVTVTLIHMTKPSVIFWHPFSYWFIALMSILMLITSRHVLVYSGVYFYKFIVSRNSQDINSEHLSRALYVLLHWSVLSHNKYRKTMQCSYLYLYTECELSISLYGVWVIFISIWSVSYLYLYMECELSISLYAVCVIYISVCSVCYLYLCMQCELSISL